MALSACPKLNIAKRTLKKAFLNCIPTVVLRLVPAPPPAVGTTARHLANPPQGALNLGMQGEAGSILFERHAFSMSLRCASNFQQQNRALWKRLMAYLEKSFRAGLAEVR